MSEGGGVDLILVRPDPVEEGPDTLRCPACGTGVSYNDGICSACGQIYCPGCGHPLDDAAYDAAYGEAEDDDRDDDVCPSCGLALSFPCPHCSFEVAAGSRTCPECSVLFVRRCPACDARILHAPEACPECGQLLELEIRTFATIFAAEMNLVILKCPQCAA